MQLPLLSLDAFQTSSEICLGCTTVLAAGTVHTRSLDVQAGFVSPFLFAASIRNSKAVTWIQQELILQWKYTIRPGSQISLKKFANLDTNIALR